MMMMMLKKSRTEEEYKANCERERQRATSTTAGRRMSWRRGLTAVVIHCLSRRRFFCFCSLDLGGGRTGSAATRLLARQSEHGCARFPVLEGGG